MASCPTCQADLPEFALHCVECGTSVAAVTVREQEAIQRLRALSGARGTGGHGTLMGSPGREASLAEGRTVPEGALEFDTIDQSVDASAETFPGEPFPATDQMDQAAPPELVSLSGAKATIRDDGPARLRDSDTPADPGPATEPPDPYAMTASRGLVRPGQRIEEYIIEAEVGRGGMGRVYRAVHEQIGQVVALKMLLPQFFNEDRQMKRFLNEARVLVHLQHPNLVPLLGFPTHEGRPLIVMPFIEGETLETLLAREGRLPLERAVDLFCQVCEGLACVHDVGVMHRDLKPANILIRATDGQALLTDFGIARAIGSERLTMTGMVVGTAEYLSPEQASGSARDDLRGDIYSVGILLYEMLTGQVPFRHANAAQVLMKQVSAQPPPPRLIVPGLSQDVESVVLRALEKDPNDRFQTVREMRDSLLAAVEGRPLPTPEPVRRKPVSEAPTPIFQASGKARAQTPVPATPRGSETKRLLGQTVLGAGIGAALATALWYLITRM